MNTDIEDLLREGMERFTADLRAPAVMTLRVARRRRRRRALRATCAVAALTAAGVTVVVIGVPGAGGKGIGNDIGVPVTPAAYVVKHVDSALSAAEPGEIAQMTITISRAATPSGTPSTTTAQEWSYDGQWRAVMSSTAGHPVYDEGFGTSSGYTVVSYLTRTWARQPGPDWPAKTAPLVPGPRDCGPLAAALPLLFVPRLPGIGLPVSSLPATGARSLRAAISCGTLIVAGRQRVDGIEAIKLTSRPDSLISETIWVSPGTYLPVRVVVGSAPGLPAVQQTADITWLPPTTQNLARLTVPVPAGFRRVPFATAVTPILRQMLGGPVPGFGGPAAFGGLGPAFGGPAPAFKPGPAQFLGQFPPGGDR